MNGVEPFAYLKVTLTAIAAGHPQSCLDNLLSCWSGRLPTASRCARMSS
ncbi:transposase domain-containing protein [Ochrobactrum quorumnocens]